MPFIKSNEKLQKNLLGSEWIVINRVTGSDTGEIWRVDEKSKCQWDGSLPFVSSMLNVEKGIRMSYYLDRSFLPLFKPTTNTVVEISSNPIIPNNKFDKYKGKLVIEIKNDKIYISNNIFNLLGGTEVLFSTSDDGKLFICKALEEQGIKPYRNRIAGNEAKNIIEIIKSIYGDKKMYSVNTTIIKDLDNPDYCFYEVQPKIDKVKVEKKLKQVEEIEELLF